jgi:NAD(P)-dependent dehydrogenase (short-subunit alcohol dehydrogenase family)
VNKWVFVSGCSSGIGRAAAMELKVRGYKVIASVRSERDQQELISQGIEHCILLDLGSDQSVEQAAEAIQALTQGTLFAIFNNGAYGQPGAVEDLSRDALRKQFEANVFGTQDLTNRLLPELIAQDEARIVQCSSILGFISMPMRGAYNASKHALEALSDNQYFPEVS